MMFPGHLSYPTSPSRSPSARYFGVTFFDAETQLLLYFKIKLIRLSMLRFLYLTTYQILIVRHVQ